MAELSVNKGRAVAQIEGASKQGSGLGRTQVAPPSRSEDEGGRRENGQEEFEEFLVEIGEEARRSLKQEQGEAAAPEAGETGPEQDKAQGAKVDVVV